MPKRGESASAAQRAALKRGQQKRKAMLEDPTFAEDTQGKRWAQLLDGSLKVADLDDEEIDRMRPRGKGGTFSGKAPKLPSHLAQQFAGERMRRAKEAIAKALPTATAEAMRILNDPDAKDADKIKIMQMVWERNLGKTPEVIRHETAMPFESLLHEVWVDRDMDFDAGGPLSEDADTQGK